MGWSRVDHGLPNPKIIDPTFSTKKCKKGKTIGVGSKGAVYIMSRNRTYGSNWAISSNLVSLKAAWNDTPPFRGYAKPVISSQIVVYFSKISTLPFPIISMPRTAEHV